MLSSEARNYFIEALSSVYDSREANNIFSIIEDDVFGLKAQWNEDDIAQLNPIIHRLLQHEPLQYILGDADFYGLKFKVTPAVLIPRPETEELVHYVIQHLKKKLLSDLFSANIIDIGTGSGCIPVTIKKSIKQAGITAIDIDENALEIAKHNAIFHDAEIQFFQLNFLDQSTWSLLHQYNVIISNPPYITAQEFLELASQVKNNEPEIALIAKHENAFIFYDRLATFGNQHLLPDGIIACELNAQHAETIQNIFIQQGYITEIIKDLQYKDRILIAKKATY